MILSVIGITVILLGLFLVVAPTFIPNLAYGNNPPNIYYCSVLYHGTYASSITTLSVSANIAPAAGSGISLVVFRYAQSAMTPTQALDPSNNYANARTLQWINVSMVTNQAANTWIIPNPGFVGPVTPDHPTPAGTIPVSRGYYYYYLVNAYSFDGSSNYFPDQGTNSILNNWFSVGSVSSNPTPTPTPTPIYILTSYDVAFTVSSGSGTLSWYDSTTSAQGGAGTYTFAANDALSVTANPAQGYQFDHFYISGTSSGSITTNPFTTNVASGFAINAYFVQIGATPSPTQPGQTPSPTYNPNPTQTPTLKPNQSPTPTPTYNPNPTPTASPAPYNPFTSPSPAPYTTVRSWAVVVIGVAFMLCGGLMVSIGQTNSRRKP